MGYTLTSADVEERVEARLKALRPTDDQMWDQTLKERDQAEEVANKLTEAVGQFLGVDFGGHSSDNCPWRNALDALNDALGSRPTL
ncbi:hypothetical protein Drose_05770 [Dactylosporangium roseum]|uniref:Uncharacterized protein n=1 Tax=Dactylosporangium roseum TaxID=47989 RepID=A0ABY5Z6V1_9ACTN|nr:hypothetical protein [Dactylosporangium roseum]UWZ37778.1 hypothetical protein Drose_05770 [Dactylosporangium roseum]